MGLLKWIEQNPLEAAAIGTAAYMTGGAALGAGGAAAGAAPAAAAATNPALIESAVGTAGYGASSAGAGGMAHAAGSGLIGSGMQALTAASMTKGLLNDPQQPIQSAQLPQQNNGINDVLQQRQQAYQQYLQNRRV